MNSTRTPVIFIHDLWLHPASWQPWLDLFQDAGYAPTANFTPHSPAEVETGTPVRGPLLLVAGGEDHAVPETVAEETFRQYRGSPAVTDLAEFADRGHSLTIDAGWRAVADERLAKQLRN
jgi:fermentation-respiration switch protein FrsA (DUF1100 family)